MAQLFSELLMACEQCFKASRFDLQLNHSTLQNPNEYMTAPEDAMQIDSFPALTPTGGY